MNTLPAITFLNTQMQQLQQMQQQQQLQQRELFDLINEQREICL